MTKPKEEFIQPGDLANADARTRDPKPALAEWTEELRARSYPKDDPNHIVAVQVVGVAEANVWHEPLEEPGK